MFNNLLIIADATPRIISHQALWSGNTAGFTFSGQSIFNNNNGNNAIRLLPHNFHGNLRLHFQEDGFGVNNGNSLWMGFYPASDDGSFSASSGTGGVFNNASVDAIAGLITATGVGSTVKIALYSGNTNDKGTTTHDNNFSVEIRRTAGGVWEWWLNGALDTTFSGTPTGPMRLAIAHPAGSDSGGGGQYIGISWFN